MIHSHFTRAFQYWLWECGRQYQKSAESQINVFLLSFIFRVTGLETCRCNIKSVGASQKDILFSDRSDGWEESALWLFFFPSSFSGMQTCYLVMNLAFWNQDKPSQVEKHKILRMSGKNDRVLELFRLLNYLTNSKHFLCAIICGKQASIF